MDTTYWKDKVQRNINELHDDHVKQSVLRIYKILKDAMQKCNDEYDSELQDIYDTYADGITYKDFSHMELIATVNFKNDLEDQIKELINEAF